MEKFIQAHREKINGTLTCFDRLIFKGYLSGVSFVEGLEGFLSRQGLLIKDFKGFVSEQAEVLKAHAHAMAEKQKRPYFHLRSAGVRKEEVARKEAERATITQGLVCIFGILEPCPSFAMRFGEGKPKLEHARRMCLCLYYYFMDPVLGLIHVRIQTWFPLTIQIYVNGHDYVARRLDRLGIAYKKIDNTFVHIDNWKRAQAIADELITFNWRRHFDGLAKQVNPLLKTLLKDHTYYWVTDQAELATDVAFKSQKEFQSFYPALFNHATSAFSSGDIMRFLGKKLHGNFAGEAIATATTRPECARIKHRIKQNWIKMYDKQNLVLRVETVINNPRNFTIRKIGTRAGHRGFYPSPLPKGVANIGHLARFAHAANHRYLNALAMIESPASAYKMLDRVAEAKTIHGRPVRGFNPVSKQDLNLFAAVLAGEGTIHGLTNRIIRERLFSPATSTQQLRKNSAAVSRLLKRLHVHGLIVKIPRSRRWKTTLPGYRLMYASLHLREHALAIVLQQLAA